MLNFCFDNFPCNTNSIPWPNLVPMPARSCHADLEKVRGDLSSSFPFIDFPRILDYLQDDSIDFQIHSVNSAPKGSIYVINVCRFNVGFDYFSLLSQTAKNLLNNKHIKILFMYNEADSVFAIQKTLYESCRKNNLNPLSVHVITSATTAQMPPNFYYFNDIGIRFKRSQNKTNGLPWSPEKKSKKMTLLSRVHKDWRAFFCSWYWHNGYHKDSYFSYRMIEQDNNSGPENNPLHGSVKFDPERKQIFNEFVSKCPFSADSLADHNHNSYSNRVDEHFVNSYWNCVLETHLNLEDDLPGVFLTEKTWKPIANAQPFVILGNAYSLQYLKSLGYRTFGECGINETYDAVLDPTERFRAVCEVVKDLHSCSFEQLHDLHYRCREIVEHNQKLFWQSERQVFVELFNKITIVD